MDLSILRFDFSNGTVGQQRPYRIDHSKIRLNESLKDQVSHFRRRCSRSTDIFKQGLMAVSSPSILVLILISCSCCSKQIFFPLFSFSISSFDSIVISDLPNHLVVNRLMASEVASEGTEALGLSLEDQLALVTKVRYSYWYFGSLDYIEIFFRGWRKTPTIKLFSKRGRSYGYDK